MILYFHGFGSHGKSWKPELLRRHLPSVRIESPTLPVNPLKVVGMIERVLSESRKPPLPIGSSFGGFYSYYVSALYDIPAVLVNPTMVPWISLASFVGMNQRYDTGEIFEWKGEYIMYLKEMKARIDQKTPNHANLNFYLSTDDESLDHSRIKDLFPDAGSIKYYNNCKHRFLRFEEIIPDIKNLLGRIGKKSQNS